MLLCILLNFRQVQVYNVQFIRWKVEKFFEFVSTHFWVYDAFCGSSDVFILNYYQICLSAWCQSKPNSQLPHGLFSEISEYLMEPYKEMYCSQNPLTASSIIICIQIIYDVRKKNWGKGCRHFHSVRNKKVSVKI